MFVWLFFFFKQKTAYEMRISDWSSDVCSSDLVSPALAGRVVLQMDQATPAHQGVLRHFGQCGEDAGLDRRLGLRVDRHRAQALRLPGQVVRMATDSEGHAVRANPAGRDVCSACATPLDRQSVVLGKGVAIRVTAVGGR